MEKKLTFWDCMGFCIGQIIGSGIMVLKYHFTERPLGAFFYVLELG